MPAPMPPKGQPGTEKKLPYFLQKKNDEAAAAKGKAVPPTKGKPVGKAVPPTKGKMAPAAKAKPMPPKKKK